MSVAYAENQSMVLDSLCGDAAWLARYARDADDKPMPFEVVEKALRDSKPYAVLALRGMIAVPYFEKALYELPDEEVTPARVMALADEVEAKVQGGLSPRPLLSVPHLLSDEASCYYHGYVLAEMAVWQTRKHFKDKYGYLLATDESMSFGVEDPKELEKLADVRFGSLEHAFAGVGGFCAGEIR